jgi:hypothetical protein
MQGGPNAGVVAPRNLGLYTYTWNNPVILRDPTGMSPENDRVTVTGSGRNQVTRIEFDDPSTVSSRAINQGHTQEQEQRLTGFSVGADPKCSTCTAIEEVGKIALPSSTSDLFLEAAAGPLGVIAGKALGKLGKARKIWTSTNKNGPRQLGEKLAGDGGA